MARRSRSRRNGRFTEKDRQAVFALIKEKWSPIQVSRRLSIDGSVWISHETIYRMIKDEKKQGGVVFKHLRHSKKKRRKRYGSRDRRGRLSNKRMIDERPKDINQRTQYGHWEADTVMGKYTKHCILTLVERKTGITWIGKLSEHTVEAVNKAFALFIKEHGKASVRTITSDNGSEFHGYKEIERITGATFYFAHPYHSWERGTNENTNGLMRQYIPKGKNMIGYSQEDCDHICYCLNTRPRQRLDFRTPIEALAEESPLVALQS